MSDLVNTSPKQVNRRELGLMALAGALGATQLGWSRSGFAQEQPGSAAPTQFPQAKPGIKLGCIASVNATDDDLLFYRQIGVDTVRLNGVKAEDCTVEGMQKLKKRFGDAGVVIDKINAPVVDGLMADIVLNGPGRDKAIEGYKAWIHTLSSAGYYYIPQMFSVTGALTSGDLEETRGGKARAFDLNSSEIVAESPTLKAARGVVKGSANTLLFGREYTKDEIWANFTYFIKQVAPVAEAVGVKIGFHPDDPPVPSMFGVPHLFSSFDDYKRALKIANSPSIGVLLCCGTWDQAPATMGDTAAAIRYFGSRQKLFEVHFRNVSSPLPRFHQTFPDYGYYDSYKIMKALVDVKYDGVVNLENTVQMVGGVRTYEAFAVGYMRAMLQRAQAKDAV